MDTENDAPLHENYTITREKGGATESRVYVRATRESLHDTITDAARIGLYPFVDPSKPMTGFTFRTKTDNKRWIKVRITGRTVTCLTYEKFLKIAEVNRKQRNRYGDDI
jgi:hypothetical protein